MIVRSWHGLVPQMQSAAFAAHLDMTGVVGARAKAGCLGAWVRRVDAGECSHFFLLTYWQDWAAVRAFAGDTPWVAVCYPDDERYGLISDPVVLHHEVSDQQPWAGWPAQDA